MKFDDVSSVEIIPGRWDVSIRLCGPSGEVIEEFVASADGYFTSHDGIWFGTRAEYEEEL